MRLALRARAALGDPIALPGETRTVEGGLAAFAAKWEVAGPVILLTRFGRFLSNKIFNCRVADTPRSYVLNLGAAGATLAPGLDPYAHAELVLEESDWLGVLFGDHTGLAPALAGRFHPSRDTALTTGVARQRGRTMAAPSATRGPCNPRGPPLHDAGRISQPSPASKTAR